MKLIVTLFAALALAASAHGDALAAPSSDSQARSAQAKTKAAKAKAAAKAKSTNAKSSKVRSTAAKAAPVVAAGAAAASVVDTDNEHVNFLEWQPVREFIDGMVAQHGFERAALEALFGQVRYIDTAVQLVKPAPPGKPKNWQAYSARFIEPIRIRAGVRFWEANAEALKRAEAAYGVPAEIIVGIIGIETIYGRDTGRFRVLDSLTTLAFAYPDSPNQAARQAFFRDELANTLVLARERGYDPFSLLGSFAGAVGLPQFMPSNILKYGVDFDNDGRVDLRGSSVDAIGSVANFLIQHGWNPEHRGPTAYAADVSPTRAWESLLGLGLEATLKPEALRAAGVVTSTPLPAENLYGLIDLQNGAEPTEYWVANDNFYAITKYNRSYFYAMSVVDLGRAVRAARPE
ncbi:membrane-bound lytic murein transglycosylase B [Massilia aurea]|uniref:Membrane-bound lytic murein transglycosylase B n=1 Tax=Massilia aurea TaxID=373040 RepID=A0A7W9U5Z5_9BURK|nr:lytic murein transglycosylase B [Massilia aurea]MBB6132217.1 membrane-bound lytic murein transglycosylase B [Massilia aurea]